MSVCIMNLARFAKVLPAWEEKKTNDLKLEIPSIQTLFAKIKYIHTHSVYGIFFTETKKL